MICTWMAWMVWELLVMDALTLLGGATMLVLHRMKMKAEAQDA